MVKVDPSKYCHGVVNMDSKKAKGTADSKHDTPVSDLTWALEERPSKLLALNSGKSNVLASDSDSSSSGSDESDRVASNPKQKSALLTVNKKSVSGISASGSESDISGDSPSPVPVQLPKWLESDSGSDEEIVSPKPNVLRSATSDLKKAKMAHGVKPKLQDYKSRKKANSGKANENGLAEASAVIIAGKYDKHKKHQTETKSSHLSAGIDSDDGDDESDSSGSADTDDIIAVSKNHNREVKGRTPSGGPKKRDSSKSRVTPQKSEHASHNDKTGRSLLVSEFFSESPTVVSKMGRVREFRLGYGYF